MPEPRFPAIDVNYTPDLQEAFAAAIKMRSLRYPANQRARLFAVTFLVMIVGGFAAGLGGVLLNRLWPSFPSWAGMAALFSLLGLFYVRVLTPWTHRRFAEMVRQARPPSEIHLTADAEGLRWRDADIDIRLRWDGVEAVFYTSQSIAFMSGLFAAIVPLSVFPSEAAQRQFIRTTLDVIPEGAARLSRSDKGIQLTLAG